MGELRNRTVLVTGAASGIGHCLAIEFAREGCPTVLVDIDPAGLRATADEVIAGGGTATCYTVDLTDPAQVDALAGQVDIDVLVNCAGTSVTAELEDTTSAQWRLIMGVNVFGPVDMVQAFLPALKRKRGAQIVNIASAFGLFSYPSMGAYCSSKHAMVGYTTALARELEPHGIKVTLVCPGITRTPFLDGTDMRGYDGEMRSRGLRRLLPLVSADPQRLARYIVDATRRGRRMVVHTWVAKLVYFASRLSPALTGAGLDLVYRIVVFMREREPGDGSGTHENVLEVVNE
jgi:NAD(P)-dependent dehydrogenase (short-subunit alcohol dehydrogenase family)